MRTLRILFILITVPLLVNPKPVVAQLTFGVKGGLNLAKFTGEDAEIVEDSPPKSRIAFAAGGFVMYQVTENLFIRPELLYVGKGSFYSYSDEFTESGVEVELKYSGEYRMNWLEVPLLAVFVPNQHLQLMAGPYMELYMNGESVFKGKSTVTYLGMSESETTDETEELKKENIHSPLLGLVLGAGINISEQIGVEARYTAGFTTLDKQPNDWNTDLMGEYEVGDIRNSGVQVLVTYTF